MGLIDMIPVSVRLGSLYVKARKIAEAGDKSNEEKLQQIYRLERHWSGKSGFDPTTVGHLQAPAIYIGKKDMARIFTSLHAPDDALRYADGLGDQIMDFLSRMPDDKDGANRRASVYEAQVFAWYYEAVAHAQKNDIERTRLLFSKINQNMLATIEADPANKRLNDVYHYMINETFETFVSYIDMYPDNKQQALRLLLNLLKTFDRRDPGNELIAELMGRYK